MITVVLFAAFWLAATRCKAQHGTRPRRQAVIESRSPESPSPRGSNRRPAGRVVRTASRPMISKATG